MRYVIIDGVIQPRMDDGISVEQRREALLSHLSQKRWEVETGGIRFMGAFIRTDEVGQAKLTGAMALFGSDPELLSIDWEAQPGIWITLDKSKLTEIAIIVGRHVQFCFSRARAISQELQSASTHAELDAAEAAIEQGWLD